MDITQNRVITAFLQSPAQGSCILEIIQGDGPISLKSEVNEVKILGNDRCCGSREVERKRIFDRTKVVELEDEVFGEVGFVPEDHPTNPYVCKPKLVTGSVDRHYARNFEVPYEFRLGVIIRQK
jgi:hypothetical protein